jgi:hypothetical protein
VPDIWLLQIALPTRNDWLSRMKNVCLPARGIRYAETTTILAGILLGDHEHREPLLEEMANEPAARREINNAVLVI